MVPGRRRCAHTFPMGPNKLPWHFHHLRQTENTAHKKSNADGSMKSLTSKREKKEAIIWGPTGVEPWSASMITGIDWKSLTIPASLPTTFDVVPSAEELNRDYTHNSYTLIHALPSQDEYDRKIKHMFNASNNYDNMERQRITFDELIDQRLSQGFQMIVEIPAHIHQKMIDSIRRAGCKETEYNRLLSIGRIYHTLSLVTEESQ
ncbi:unnamed protein product [Adineta steineri]|uniref:Uncharacterized protein n=1 Tax=Adineta steineri TaxID=433720 RepID=A0A815SI43_9BILA|nr:unnamed protein product [Adineta steineri]CAF1641477.1 unnamed protein product [Adineta steineri]